MLIVAEISNQDMVKSQYVTNMRKAIKTENSYYIFMELCNGNDLKDLMDNKAWKL